MLALADRRSGALAAVCCSRSSASLLTASARSLRSRPRSALSLANSSSGCFSQPLIFCSIPSQTSRNLPIVVDLNTFLVAELCQRTTGSRRYALRSSSPTPRSPSMR